MPKDLHGNADRARLYRLLLDRRRVYGQAAIDAISHDDLEVFSDLSGMVRRLEELLQGFPHFWDVDRDPTFLADVARLHHSKVEPGRQGAVAGCRFCVGLPLQPRQNATEEVT